MYVLVYVSVYVCVYVSLMLTVETSINLIGLHHKQPTADITDSLSLGHTGAGVGDATHHKTKRDEEDGKQSHHTEDDS